MPEILLRFVEGAAVALYQHDASQRPELIPSRKDLYAYSGGYAWGCGGVGPVNLSFAIVGKLFEFDGFYKPELSRRARVVLDEVISKLDAESEHDLPVEKLKQLFE